MYNILYGENKQSDIILDFLNLTRSDFGRFRNVFVDLEENYIQVYTRCGGGNREYYQEVFDLMLKHPLYIRDEDDDFDCTYCSFYFRVSEDALLKYIESK
jgi:hypothetical protein